ncbi:MAG: transposase [Phenylobacterium sp.]|nr:transposase [Phenylobacterium sp.]
MKSERVPCDEIWSFNYCKQRNVGKATAAPLDAGDVWTGTAIDADTKLMITYAVGDRTLASARLFIDDLHERLANRVQLTSDGHAAYVQAVEGAFGDDVDFAQLVKIYKGSTSPAGRYSPPECVGARKHRVTGNPDDAHVSTSYVERSNLSIRMANRRFTGLTNAFSKKIDNHLYALALYFAFYNFVRIHKTLKVTPAMAAGITDKLWSLEDIAERIEAARQAWAVQEASDGLDAATLNDPAPRHKDRRALPEVVMRNVVMSLIAMAWIGGSATASAADNPKAQPVRPAWGCKVDHEPARRVPRPGAPSEGLPHDERINPPNQPAYCDAPKSQSERDRTSQAARPL